MTDLAPDTGLDPDALALSEQGGDDLTDDGATPQLEAQDDEGQSQTGAEDGAPEGDQGAEEFEDYEKDGVKYSVHKALKDDLLRHADYTRKTQELSQSRQSFEAEAATRLQNLQQREQAIQGVEEAAKTVTAERAALIKAQGTLEQFDQAIDAAFQQGDQATVTHLQWEKGKYERTVLAPAQQAAEAAERTLAEQRQQLSAKVEEGQKLAIQQGIRALEADPDVKLTTDVFNRVSQEAQQMFGFSQQEVFNVALADPRMFKCLKAGLDAITELKKLKTTDAARRSVPPAAARPATRVGGTAGANVRKTTDASGDALSVEEWMRREDARERAARSQTVGRRHPLVT